MLALILRAWLQFRLDARLLLMLRRKRRLGSLLRRRFRRLPRLALAHGGSFRPVIRLFEACWVQFRCPMSGGVAWPASLWLRPPFPDHAHDAAHFAQRV